MVKWARSTGTDRAASLNRLEATSTGAGPEPPPTWPTRPTRQSETACALGVFRPHYWRHDPAASVRTAAAHGFRPCCEFPRPHVPPTASSRLVTLIPSPLWPIDEAKSHSSSFPRSHPLRCSTCRCRCWKTTSTSITRAAPRGALASSCRPPSNALEWADVVAVRLCEYLTMDRPLRSTPMHPRAPSPPHAPHRHLQPCEQPPHGSLTGATLRPKLRRRGQPCRVRLFLHQWPNRVPCTSSVS
jgi:hypothetical protein